jgi:hypothetical protein
MLWAPSLLWTICIGLWKVVQIIFHLYNNIKRLSRYWKWWSTHIHNLFMQFTFILQFIINLSLSLIPFTTFIFIFYCFIFYFFPHYFNCIFFFNLLKSSKFPYILFNLRGCYLFLLEIQLLIIVSFHWKEKMKNI